MRGMGCALSIHQKECQKSLGCALYIGTRYLPENTVIALCLVLYQKRAITGTVLKERPTKCILQNKPHI
jgi:hypothetical protein